MESSLNARLGGQNTARLIFTTILICCVILFAKQGRSDLTQLNFFFFNRLLLDSARHLIACDSQIACDTSWRMMIYQITHAGDINTESQLSRDIKGC